MVIRFGPKPSSVPAAGDCVTVTPPQLSLATTLPVKSGTAAWHELLAGADCGGAQVVITGGVVSLTVKVVVHVEELFDASVTVMVIRFGPEPSSVPATGDCVTVTPLQLSLATTLPVKSGTAAWHELLAGADCGGAQVVITGGVGRS